MAKTKIPGTYKEYRLLEEAMTYELLKSARVVVEAYVVTDESILTNRPFWEYTRQATYFWYTLRGDFIVGQPGPLSCFTA